MCSAIEHSVNVAPSLFFILLFIAVLEDHRITTCVGFIKSLVERHRQKSSNSRGSLPKIDCGTPPASPSREDTGISARLKSQSLSQCLPSVPGNDSARSGSVNSHREQDSPRVKDGSCTSTPQVMNMHYVLHENSVEY